MGLFRKTAEYEPDAQPETRPASIGDDRRVYAIGDIHGRADLLADLLRRIDADDAGRDPCPTELILLGDLIDRGPQSRQVVEHALHLTQSGAPIRCLTGNHEEVFLSAAQGDIAAVRFFCRIGGQETLMSYGLGEADIAAMDAEAICAWMLEHIPRSHVDFVGGFTDMIEIGDYAFVHAGVRPGVALDEQTPADLRWIRNVFLTSDAAFGKVVIHGHTITQDVADHPNRIGIDTGAYKSGRLTAIGLQGSDHWFLSTLD